jgi:hypothetical protein
MTFKKRILAGALALAIGSSMAIPTTVRADDWWHHHDSHDRSWSDRDHDHHRDRDRDRHDWERDRNFNHRSYGYYNPNAGRRIPPNGEGMINNQNPNLYWACDSDGHHCHWARR